MIRLKDLAETSWLPRFNLVEPEEDLLLLLVRLVEESLLPPVNLVEPDGEVFLIRWKDLTEASVLVRLKELAEESFVARLNEVAGESFLLLTRLRSIEEGSFGLDLDCFLEAVKNSRNVTTEHTSVRNAIP